LPEAVKLGIAPALSHAAHTTYWGTQVPHQERIKRNSTQWLLGVRHPVANQAARVLQDKVSTQLCNARQLIGLCKGGHGQGEYGDYPEEVEGEVPEEPNLYTDGGVKNPTNQHFAIAGFGLWWPKQKEVAPNPYLQAKVEEHGTAMWAGLRGNSVSSTRTELAAIVVACMWPIALHIGTDSLAVVRKAGYLIRTAAKWNDSPGLPAHTRRNPCGRPWSMQPDGDLWHQFWNATLARGPQAIKISKVKGHSTDKDISEGKTTEHDRKGNDEADKAATSGTEAVMDGLVALAMWVQDRHASYCKFMHRVHTVIIAVHKAEKNE
jgi:hypothetical protein